MKALLIFIALCMNSLLVTGAFAADEESEMRRACPKSEFETWDKAEERAACEAKYKAGPEKIHEHSDGYIENNDRREKLRERNDRIDRPTGGAELKGRLR